MKFLIDAQLPPALCGWLRERGHQAVHVSEIGLLAATPPNEDYTVVGTIV